MYYKSKTISLYILSMTAFACALLVALISADPLTRTFFGMVGVAIMVFCLSLIAYVFNPSIKDSDLVGVDDLGITALIELSRIPMSGFKRILLGIGVQIAISAALTAFLIYSR
jgi:hypothetical protein